MDLDDRCAYINVLDSPWFRDLSEALCSVLEVFCVRDTETSVFVRVLVSETERDSEKVSFKGAACKISQLSDVRVCSRSASVWFLSGFSQ